MDDLRQLEVFSILLEELSKSYGGTDMLKVLKKLDRMPLNFNILPSTIRRKIVKLFNEGAELVAYFDFADRIGKIMAEGDRFVRSWVSYKKLNTKFKTWREKVSWLAQDIKSYKDSL